jgi:hypothetical protein
MKRKTVFPFAFRSLIRTFVPRNGETEDNHIHESGIFGGYSRRGM